MQMGIQRISGDQVLEQLLDGNQRYVEIRRRFPNESRERRLSLLEAQHPSAIILGCSDSRVPPEIIFDQGLGSLFVIRVAGNVVDEIVLASIEYAAEHLHTPLLMVLGHTNCGAVAATLADAELDGHLPSLAEAISDAVENITGEADLLDKTIRKHAVITAQNLRRSGPILRNLVEGDKLKVVAAYYDLETGIVEIL